MSMFSDTEYQFKLNTMKFSKLSLLPINASDEDKVHAAIEDITNKYIISVVSESKNYSYKTTDINGNNIINAISIDFVNDYANI